jgi:hypothetical protein
LINSPVRKGDEGPVVFIGKQENEEEIMRQHFLMQKMRGNIDSQLIERDNPIKKFVDS